MKNLILSVTALSIILLCFILPVWLVCTNEGRTWNNGICSNCKEGQWLFLETVQFCGDLNFCYECNKCGKIECFEEQHFPMIYKETNS